MQPSIRAGASAAQGSTNAVNAFITRLYNDLFHRAPSATELAQWAAELTSGGARTTVVQALCSTPGTDLRTGQLVNVLFRAFFERRADAPTQLFYAGRLKKAVLPTVVALLSSEEYYRSATS